MCYLRMLTSNNPYIYLYVGWYIYIYFIAVCAGEPTELNSSDKAQEQPAFSTGGGIAINPGPSDIPENMRG